MSLIGPQFEKYLEKISTYKIAANLEKNSIELKLIEQLIDKLAIACKGCNSDRDISYQQIFNIKISCCPLADPDMTTLLVQDLEPYCNKLIAARQAFAHDVLDFVHDYKCIKNKKFFPVEKYNTDIVPYLTQLLYPSEIPSSLSQIPFEKVVHKMNESLVFSKTDLGNWLRLRATRDSKFLNEVKSAANVVPRVHFPAGEYKIDPLLRERYERYRCYQEASSDFLLKESNVLLHMSKNENQPANEMVVDEMCDLAVKDHRSKPSTH